MVLPVSAVPFLCKCFSKQNPAVGTPTAGFYLFLYLRSESIVIVVIVVIAIAVCSGN